MPALKIDIDMETCNGCMTCMKACFVDVIRWEDSEKKPVVAYPDDCVWCFACEIACPEQCIEVIPEIRAGKLIAL